MVNAKGVNIYLDDDLDNRPTPPHFKRFVSGEDLIQYLVTKPDINWISFDNDLGQGKLEGYDVVKYMVNHGIGAGHYNVHSRNIVAEENMQKYLESAMEHGVIRRQPVTTYKETNLITKEGFNKMEYKVEVMRAGQTVAKFGIQPGRDTNMHEDPRILNSLRNVLNVNGRSVHEIMQNYFDRVSGQRHIMQDYLSDVQQNGFFDKQRPEIAIKVR